MAHIVERCCDCVEVQLVADDDQKVCRVALAPTACEDSEVAVYCSCSQWALYGGGTRQLGVARDQHVFGKADRKPEAPHGRECSVGDSC